MDFHNYTLITILCIVLIFNFIYSIKIMPTKINPSSMYGFGFMVGAIMCYVFKSEWEMYDWGMMTFMLVLVGVLSFTLANSFLIYISPIKKATIYFIQSNKFY